MVAMMSWGINISEQGWRKGPWTAEEDKLLSEYVTFNGEGRWSSVARCAGLNRSGKSCRLRWVNYLRPGLKRGQITPQEEGIIIELHALWGNKWSTIARYLPGRTDNEIKNFWRTHYKKKGKPSHQKQLMQKRRSQVLKEKLQMDKLQAKEANAKTTELVVSPQMGITSDQAEAKTTSISIDHHQAPQQEIKHENNTALITRPTSDNQTNNPVMYQDVSTPLFPWSDAVADQEYGLWGGLWNLDDMNYCEYGRMENLDTLNNINNQHITSHVNNCYGSGDVYSNKINNNVVPIQNQARAFSSCGGYIF